MLQHIEKVSSLYDDLKMRTARLAAAVPQGATVNTVGSMFTIFFTSSAVTDYNSAKKSDTVRFGEFFRFLLNRGIYFPPSQFEAAFVSSAHCEDEIQATEAAIKAYFSGSG
jgi:glutamate-1-semialdehyde 2,1-aminomutase